MEELVPGCHQGYFIAPRVRQWLGQQHQDPLREEDSIDSAGLEWELGRALNISDRLGAVPSPDLVDQIFGEEDTIRLALPKHHVAGNVRLVPAQYNQGKYLDVDESALMHLFALVEHRDPEGEDTSRLTGVFSSVQELNAASHTPFRKASRNRSR